VQRTEENDESDLDILVTFADPIGLLDLVRLEQDLSEHLAVDVDLVTERSLKPRIRSRVIDEVVYA
jgi:predicted nucleotidyltransferase